MFGTSQHERARAVALVVPTLLVLSSLACKDDPRPEDAPSGERTKEPVPETPKDAPTGPFASFDFEAAKSAWQGSWVLEGEVAGKQVAWMIDGEQLVEFDGERERELEFSLYSPCQVAYTETLDDGSTTGFKSFTFARDTLHAGLGAAGTVAGDTTIACAGGKTYTLRGDQCQAWSEMFNDWKAQPAECAVQGEGAERKFVVDGRELSFFDDMALGTEQLRGNVATKYPNFEAAKAALAGAAGADSDDAPK